MSAMDEILNDLAGCRDTAAGMRELLLADLLHIGETPSPTGAEERRVEFFLQRLAEAGAQNCSTDEKGNGVGILPGTDGQRNILLFAYADTFVSNPQDQTVEIEIDRVVGPFVGDNSLGLASLILLPSLLEKLRISLRSNVILMAAARTLGRGNLEGLKAFLASGRPPIHHGICLESVQFGRLNYTSLGMLRCEIVCRMPDDYNWVNRGATGTITPMSEMINHINGIPIPRRPLTSIVLGSIHGGISSRNIARQTTLSFEVRSESADVLTQIQQTIEHAAEEISARSGTRITLDVFSQRQPGGLEASHPLVQSARGVIGALAVQPMIYATTSAMSALVDLKIPALTLGITTGTRFSQLDEIDEALAIAPMAGGLAQVVGILRAIDEGICDV